MAFWLVERLSSVMKEILPPSLLPYLQPNENHFRLKISLYSRETSFLEKSPFPFLLITVLLCIYKFLFSPAVSGMWWFSATMLRWHAVDRIKSHTVQDVFEKISYFETLTPQVASDRSMTSPPGSCLSYPMANLSAKLYSCHCPILYAPHGKLSDNLFFFESFNSISQSYRNKDDFLSKETKADKGISRCLLPEASGGD
jgi:hypothetical protein